MRAITVLAAVILGLTGCGKSGDSGSDSTQSAQGVNGTYSVKATRPNGDVILMFAKFSVGQYEISDYKFTAGDMSKASYVKFIASDTVTGITHHVTLNYATCQTLNGITNPTSESFPVTPLNNGKISLHSNGANADILMDKSESAEQTMADLGVYLATEITDCSAAF